MPNALFAQAAFRHKVTGHVTGTGSHHDITLLPCGGEHLDNYDDGFLGHDGKFYTREQAKGLAYVPLHHDGSKLHSEDLHLSELELAKSVRDYEFVGPVRNGHLYSVHAKTKDGKTVGQLTFHASAVADMKHPHHGFHRIDQADVSALHRKRGLYGRMLQLGSMFVKTQLKSRGLVSEGQWRSEAATGAWEKLAQKNKVQKLPGLEPEAPDFRMSEPREAQKLGASDLENLKHEFLLAWNQWLKRRTLRKDEFELLRFVQGNLSDVTDEHHEVACSMLGIPPQQLPEFQAARFMANTVVVSDETFRLALLCYEHDLEMAALFAYNLPRTEASRAALRTVMGLQNLRKDELDVAAIPRQVEAVFPEGQEFAAALQRAFGAGAIQSVKLGGKHSKGTALAVDPKDHKKYLIKPGSGSTSPSAGVNEQLANQSRREVAFAQVARALGLGEYLPNAHLLRMDGHEVAVMELIPPTFRNLNQRRREPNFAPRAVFEPYRKNGELFKWAAMDMLLGNPDRHAGNAMIGPEGEVQLIDHGTSFAGFAFDPAADDKSFIPCYLRAWSSENFKALTPDRRLKLLPTADPHTAEAFSTWVEQVSEPQIVQILGQYGILHDPTAARLDALRAVAPEQRVEWVLSFWAGKPGA
jgi:hypothetical protein